VSSSNFRMHPLGLRCCQFPLTAFENDEVSSSLSAATVRSFPLLLSFPPPALIIPSLLIRCHHLGIRLQLHRLGRRHRHLQEQAQRWNLENLFRNRRGREFCLFRVERLNPFNLLLLPPQMPLVIFFFRMRIMNSTQYQKHAIQNRKVSLTVFSSPGRRLKLTLLPSLPLGQAFPYKLAIRRYWKPFLGCAGAWFLYDVIICEYIRAREEGEVL